MNEQTSNQPFSRTVPIGGGSADKPLPGREARTALEKVIREIPDDKLRASGVLLASFRGGHITVIV